MNNTALTILAKWLADANQKLDEGFYIDDNGEPAYIYENVSFAHGWVNFAVGFIDTCLRNEQDNK